jgi:hypothetical protein
LVGHHRGGGHHHFARHHRHHWRHRGYWGSVYGYGDGGYAGYAPVDAATDCDECVAEPEPVAPDCNECAVVPEPVAPDSKECSVAPVPVATVCIVCTPVVSDCGYGDGGYDGHRHFQGLHGRRGYGGRGVRRQ